MPGSDTPHLHQTVTNPTHSGWNQLKVVLADELLDAGKIPGLVAGGGCHRDSMCRRGRLLRAKRAHAQANDALPGHTLMVVRPSLWLQDAPQAGKAGQAVADVDAALLAYNYEALSLSSWPVDSMVRLHTFTSISMPLRDKSRSALWARMPK